MTLQALADAFAAAVTRTGPFAPVLLVVASFIEYLLPPFPGDFVVVLGAWYVVQGQLSWVGAFASVMAGSVVGAWVDHRIGRAVGRRLEARAPGRTFLSAERLAAFEASYRRWGDLLILANRFFPGVRAFIFVAAGASGVPLRKVLLLGALSAALWNVLLLGAGALVARNVDDLLLLVDRYTRAAWAALALAALVALVAWLVRRRRGPGAGRGAGA